MKHGTPGVHAVRLAFLVALLCGALTLYRWSRMADPRFYRFLRSRPGQFLAKTFRWNAPPPAGVHDDKPEGEMTPEELAVKRELEAEIEASAPRQRVVLDTGKTMTGRVLEEHPDYVVFQETYGPSGSLSAQIRRTRIRSIENVTLERPAITYRDVRFKMEFPRMNLYRRPPYTVMTDETFFHVEQSVRVLEQLHQEFVTLFRPLIAKPHRAPNIQLLFFSDQPSFDRYRATFAPQMEGARGFYSPWLDRLIIFNEKRSDEVTQFAQEFGEPAADYAAQQTSEETAERIRLLKRQIQRDVEHVAEKRTYITLRHEGAHQLFFTYGVHSSDRVENEWLIEGLATVCETRPIGDKDPQRISLLKGKLATGETFPLADLINFRHAKGFVALGGPSRVDLAYSQSWALVRYLMEPERRNQFFEYVRYLRDPQRFYSVLAEPPVELLCRFLQSTPERLEADWAAYVRRL